jgi:hypothetical protein
MNAKHTIPSPATLPLWLLDFISPFIARMEIVESYLSAGQLEDADDRFRCECEKNGWTDFESFLSTAYPTGPDSGSSEPHPSPKVSS